VKQDASSLNKKFPVVVADDLWRSSGINQGVAEAQCAVSDSRHNER